MFHSEGVDKFIAKHGQRSEIPCKPTHPDVTVTLKRNNLIAVEPLSKVRCNEYILVAHCQLIPILCLQDVLKQDLLSLPNPKWKFDKQTGLTLDSATLSDYGSYDCHGKLRNTTSKIPFNIVVKGFNSYVSTDLYVPLTLDLNGQTELN